MKQRGHSINFPSLIEALTICARSGIELERSHSNILSSNIFPTLLMTNRQKWLENPKAARCYVQFNPLVTQSVNHLTYRQSDYGQFMEHKRQLTRWPHKRLSHNYLQASWENTYHITQTTIIRDSGLVNSKRASEKIKGIVETLDELKETDVLTTYDYEVIRGKRNKIDEVKYCLTPHYLFVEEMKKANKRNVVIFEEAEQMGILNRAITSYSSHVLINKWLYCSRCWSSIARFRYASLLNQQLPVRASNLRCWSSSPNGRIETLSFAGSTFEMRLPWHTEPEPGGPKIGY